MKVWPFDALALRNQGQFITRSELEQGLAPLRQIRDAVGDEMEVALEFHGYWNLPAAVRIARACEPYRPLWLEELLPQDNLEAYARLKQETALPLILSERLMTRWHFREVIERGLAQIVNPDLCWCGGLSEAKKIAALAETHYLPLAPHNCGGPVLHAASLHLAQNLPNLFLLESVRRHYLQDYAPFVTYTGAAVQGVLAAPEAPGLGTELRPEVWNHPRVSVRSIA
jgi:L-alanine-DL-glutamate epimerase-like enolase superfamily enzyme